MNISDSGYSIGKVAAICGITTQALRNRIKRPELQEFFSPAAKGKPGKPSHFDDHDYVIAVSVNSLLEQGKGWDEIAHQLRSGWRETKLPEDVVTVAAKTNNSMMLAGRAVSAEDRLELLFDQVEQKDKTIAELQHRLLNSEREHTQTVERIMRELGVALAGKAFVEGQLQELRESLKREGQG